LPQQTTCQLGIDSDGIRVARGTVKNLALAGEIAKLATRGTLDFPDLGDDSLAFCGQFDQLPISLVKAISEGLQVHRGKRRSIRPFKVPAFEPGHVYDALWRARDCQLLYIWALTCRAKSPCPSI
jgi:hypothetical protein